MSWQTIELSPSAIEATKRYYEENPAYKGQSLRLYLEGKGCDGFFYGVTFDDPTPDDLHFEITGVDVVVDPDAIEFVQGSTIDFVDDERGKGYLVENPNHRKFRGKFYKRQVWQDRLLKKKIIGVSHQL